MSERLSRAPERVRRPFIPARLALALTAGGAALLAGCATVDINQSVARVNQEIPAFTRGQLSIAQSDADRAAFQNTANTLLARPLAQDDAVHLALINSPAMQTMLAQSWVDAANAAQAGRLPNPVLTFERLRLPLETDIGRMLAFGLLDVLTLPQRKRSAHARIGQVQLQLTTDVIEKVTQVRQAWVAALAAKQSLAYAQ